MHPFELVLLLMTIAAENKRMELVEFTYAQTVAVAHSLDLAFNAGKGKILSEWVENMVGDMLKHQKQDTRKTNKPVISDETFALLGNLPKFKKEIK